MMTSPGYQSKSGSGKNDGSFSMKFLTHVKFLFLLLRRGTLLNAPVDYEQLRKKSLADLPRHILPTELLSKKSSREIIRSKLLRYSILGSLIGTIAFLKNPDQVYRQFFISHHQKLIYVRIFKCGSISILKSLLPHIHGPLENFPLKDSQIDTLAHYFLRQSLPDDMDGYVIFGVTRNPLERLVSAYLDIFSKPETYNDFLFGIFRKKRSFKQVVEAMYCIPDKYRGPHFVTQSRVLAQVKRKKVLIFKLNDNHQTLTSFLLRYNLSLVYQNKSRIAYNYKDYYDNET
jgi:Sulfotransferase family